MFRFWSWWSHVSKMIAFSVFLLFTCNIGVMEYKFLFSKYILTATLPGMWDRTITIGSAGKSFSVTGWKLGWMIGPSNLLAGCKAVQQHCIGSVGAPLQVLYMSKNSNFKFSKNFKYQDFFLLRYIDLVSQTGGTSTSHRDRIEADEAKFSFEPPALSEWQMQAQERQNCVCS